MSNPAVPPPSYQDNPEQSTQKTYGSTASEPLLASQRGMLSGMTDDEEAGPIDPDYKDERNVDGCEMEIRMAFIRKVYSILLVQLVTTTAISAALHLSSSATKIMHSTPSLMFIPLIGSFLTLFGVSYRRHVYPSNLILLGAFTICESFLIGMVTSYTESRLLLQALALTSGVFVGLTLFTYQSKYDFSSMGPMLSAGLWGLIGVGLIQFFLPFNQVSDLIVASFGVLIFSGYVVYDSYNIMKRLSPDEYIFGALSLYLDFINLFLYILRVLNNTQRN